MKDSRRYIYIFESRDWVLTVQSSMYLQYQRVIATPSVRGINIMKHVVVIICCSQIITLFCFLSGEYLRKKGN